MIAVALALVAGLIALWLRGSDMRAGPARAADEAATRVSDAAPAAAKLDVRAYVAAHRARMERAKRLAEERKAVSPRPLPAGGGSGSGSTTAGAIKMKGRSLLEPSCVLGTAELCGLLAGVIDECDAGDGQACLAVAQYLADTPPRPLIAVTFFVLACRRGEEAGCERNALVKSGAMPEACADDPFVCAWIAYKAKDVERLDDACALGVADACAWMIEHYQDDAPRARAYLEMACQLGNPMTCMELGRRLSPGCTPAPDQPCYPPEPAEAAAARAIACAAGWKDACS